MTGNIISYDETVPEDIKAILQSHKTEIQQEISGNARLIWQQEAWDADRKLYVLYKGDVSDASCLAEFSPDEVQGPFETVLARIFDGEMQGYSRFKNRV